MTVADEYEIETASGSLQERSLRVTELLLGAGAHVLTKNDRNSTPLDVASGDGVRVLLLSAVQALQRQQEEEVKAQSHRSLEICVSIMMLMVLHVVSGVWRALTKL